MKRRLAVAVTLGVVLLIGWASIISVSRPPEAQGQPLRGVWPPPRSSGFTLIVTPHEVLLVLGDLDPGRAPLGLRAAASLQARFVGANPRPTVAGLEELAGRFGRLVGSDPTVPHTGMVRYRRVRYFDIYPGVDLSYAGGRRRLEYEVTVKPGADPGRVRLAFQGARELRLDRQGNLVLRLADREVVQAAPAAYQVIGGQRRTARVTFDIRDRMQVGLRPTGYDRTHPLVISGVFDYGSKWPAPPGCDLGGGPGYLIPKYNAIDNLGPYIEGWFYLGGLEAGLDNCPTLRDSLVWETGGGQRIPFAQWDPEQKAVLYEYYDRLMTEGETADLAISCPSPEKNKNTGAWSYDLYLTADESFRVYAAHVAWALYLEAKKLVPWSLVGQTKGGREEILASYRYHSRIKPSQSAESYPSPIKPDRDFQPPFEDQGNGVLRCDPRLGYWFVRGQSKDHPFQKANLLGDSEEGTLGRLTAWLRVNVGHGGGFGTPKGMLERGVFLGDRLKAKLTNDNNPNRWLIDSPVGCHTAASLLYDLAKSVNLPLRHVRALEDRHCGANFGNCTHGGLVYRWDGPKARVLWHADNLYAEAYTSPTFPIDVQNQPLSAAEADKQYFEAFWVPPNEVKSWGFDYKLELTTPQLAASKFKAVVSQAYEDVYDYGYVAGYWLRSDRAMGAYADDQPVLNTTWKNDLQNLYRLERLHQLCSWQLVQYYATFGDGAKWQLDGVLDDYEQRKRVGFRPWWLHPHQEYWDRTKACVNAYGGGQAVVQLEKKWNESRGYPK